jgi:hypothetical protein
LVGSVAGAVVVAAGAAGLAGSSDFRNFFLKMPLSLALRLLRASGAIIELLASSIHSLKDWSTLVGDASSCMLSPETSFKFAASDDVSG